MGLTENLVLPPIGAVSIRVGRNCGGGALNCTTVEIYSMQTYCKRVLPAEWFACWGSLPNGMNSLLAGAVAIRSYATWHVKNPLTSNYDICDNTACQFFGSTTSSNSNVAVDQTIGYVLVNSNDAIPRAEYSAENNNKGCGNGYSGTGTSWPCIYDPVCLNMTPNGHGRGCASGDRSAGPTAPWSFLPGAAPREQPTPTAPRPGKRSSTIIIPITRWWKGWPPTSSI